ncbi:phage major capsid protein [Paenibacillus lupini]|uniref:phage major capsid protein n=1 Tax=Paenibacillus lupini TaxID=1450204 RepID=UPI00141E8A4D|nr:phage major capsid protein [Paenibacillus lupini]NIK24199.1 HK97 family phage major capsid protein [Paenibacillus lupini]
MTKNEYLAKRKTLLNEADQLINAGKLDEYEAKENEIKALDAQYEDAAKAQANAAAMQGRLAVLTNASIIKDGNDDEGAGGTVLAATQEPTPQIARNSARGKALKANNAVTVGAGTVVTPRHSASDIRPTFNQVSSLIDRVGYKELKGGETFRQPYIVGYGTADYTAAEGDDYNTAEPTFAYADINKTKVTAYAEDSEEIMKLPDADYDGEVMKGITIASRKKLTREILIGTGAANRLTGIFSTAATAIDASTDLAISAIDASTLDDIIFSFGGDEEVEDAAVLILNKKDLKAFAKLRGTDGKKIYNVVSNGNTGTIDGVPFIINSACKAITDAATTAGQFGMAYGPLSNYLLTVFSDLDVQRSTDFKFKQGMIAHRGSIFAGGNVVSKNGFLRVKKSV